MSKEADIMFYISPTIAPVDRRRILRLADSIPTAAVEEVSRKLTIHKNVRTAIACGGDGTALAVAEQLDEDQILAVDPCGSHNGLARTLLHEKSFIRPSELGDPQVIATIKSFKPGILNENKFIHGACWDSVGLMQAEITEKIRWVFPPVLRSVRLVKTMRAYFGAAYAALKYLPQTDQEYPITLTLLSGFLGGHRLTDMQSLYSDALLVARIEGGSDLVSRLSRIYFYLFMKQIPPHGLITFIQTNSFSETTDKPITRVVVDAEVKTLDTRCSEVVVRRSDVGIKAALLVSSAD